MIRVLLVLILHVAAAMGQQSLAAKPTRLPLEKTPVTLKSPTKYERRIVRADPKTGKLSYYDPKPRVVLLDAKLKKYGLRWIGYDGTAKTVIYQSPDAIDVVVSAS